jgi:hypothetical protein
MERILRLTSARALVSLHSMPRPKPNALAELTSWMDQAYQLESALQILDARVAPRGAKAKASRPSRRKKDTTHPQPDPEVH